MQLSLIDSFMCIFRSLLLEKTEILCNCFDWKLFGIIHQQPTAKFSKHSKTYLLYFATVKEIQKSHS